jgi:HEAT repeat protein
MATSQARSWSGAPTAFELDLHGLLSGHGETRRRAFDRFAAGWADLRMQVADLARSPDRPRRLACAYLLAQLGDLGDLPAMRRLLGDGWDAVRMTVLPGIVRLRDHASLTELASIVEKAAYEELCRLLPAVAQIDAAAGEALCMRLANDERWARRRAAAQCLGTLQTPRSAIRLLGLLADGVWSVQVDAVDSCGHRRLADAREPLRALRTHPEWQVRAAVATALGAIGVSQDLEAVASLATDDANKYVRRAGLAALGGFAGDLPLTLLETAVSKEADEKARGIARDTLAARRERSAAPSQGGTTR